MHKRPLGKSGLQITPIAFGAFKIGRNTGIKYPTSYALPSESDSTRLLNTVLDLGINYIDTAPAYGESEERIGHALSHRRKEIVLSTKVGEHFNPQTGESTYDYSARAIRRSVETSLKRLRTDALDLVFIHSDGNDLDILNHSPAVETLQELKHAGQIRAIGLSSKTVEGTHAALPWADAVMVTYHQNDQSHADVIAQAHKANVGVVIKKGLASGNLPAETAIHFVLSNPAVTSLVVGSLNQNHLCQNIAAAEQARVPRVGRGVPSGGGAADPCRLALAVCSWSLRPTNPEELVQRVHETGLNQIQLHLNPITTNPAVWGNTVKALQSHNITPISGMINMVGEDYSTLESIRKTGGVIPDQHWDANWKIVQSAANVANDAGITLISTHAGFVPHNPADPAFKKIVDRIAQIASHFAKHNITLLLETGQETAQTLTQFLQAVENHGAPNVGVNFDPANMILYDKGDPIDSLQSLLPHVKQVHIKDAQRTAAPGQWGKEMPVGHGQVDWQAFIKTLAAADFHGNLVIEREGGDNRIDDVKNAAALIKKLAVT